MDKAITIEVQDGVNWSKWKDIASGVSESGFDGLFRSDHFTNPSGPYRDALELWVSLSWLADNTQSIQFGPLVSPVSLRNPVFTARMAKDIDNLSNGRLNLGVGAGWQEREHEAFGFDLLDIPQRFDRFEEGLAVIKSLLHDSDPTSFDGEYYTLREANLLPKPDRHIPITVGGTGRNRTLPLVAEYADEWNGNMIPPQQFKELNEYLDELLEEQNRDPGEVQRSVLTRVIFGENEEKVRDKVEKNTHFDTIDKARKGGLVVGTHSEVLEQLDAYRVAGADKVVIQWLKIEQLDQLEALGDTII